MFFTRDIKQRQAAQTPNVVFVVASHYQSLQVVFLLLQACTDSDVEEAYPPTLELVDSDKEGDSDIEID